MILSLADLAVIVALGIVVWRRGRDRRVESSRPARWLRIAGLIPPGLLVAFFLFFGIGEMASGDLSGAGHLLPAAAVALLAVLAWMRPLEGGIALIAGGVVAAIPPAISRVISPATLVIAAPQILSGVLFFVAGMLAGRASASSGQT
jgi:hypothetical protein